MAKPIHETLRHIQGGVFIDDCADALADVVNAVCATGKAGSLTIKIDIRKATAGALAVSGKYVVKKPAEPVTEALMFPTPEGNLLTEDPRQQRLELRSVDSTIDASELKTVSAS